MSQSHEGFRGSIAELLGYYLAAIRGWGYLLAIIYCFPSIGLVILSMISGGVGAISGWLSEKFHRF